MSDEALLTPAEAAAYLKLASVRSFYDWRRRHGIPNRTPGRALRVFKSDLLRPASRVVDMRTVDFRALGRAHARGER